MKHCPSCNRDYEDDSLRFCLEDGTRLESNDTSRSTAEPTMVLPGYEPVPTTISQVARPEVPLPGKPRVRVKPTEPAVEMASGSSSSATTVRIVIASLGAIGFVLLLVGFAMWGYMSVRRIPAVVLFLSGLVFAFVRASRHPKVSLLVGLALGLDLIEPFVYSVLNRAVSGLHTPSGLTYDQVQAVQYVLTLIDDFILAGILILLTMAVLTGRKSALETT